MNEKTRMEKVKDFIEKYNKLCNETGLVIVAYPKFVPDETGRFVVTMDYKLVEKTESKENSIK